MYKQYLFKSLLYKAKYLLKSLFLIKSPIIQLGDYYQWVAQAKPDMIYDKTGLFYLRNYGYGGSDIDVQILNTYALTSDGTLTISFNDLSGRSIIDSKGTSTPTINGNAIELSIGYISYLELDNGEKFYFGESKSVEVHSDAGTIGTLSTDVNVWTLHNDIEPWGLMLGGTLFQNDTDSEYLRIVGIHINSKIGYTKVGYFSPLSGLWNTGNTYEWIQSDQYLQAIADFYSIANPITWEQLYAIDTDVIPSKDLTIQNSTELITNWGTQDIVLQDENGDPLLDENDEILLE